MELLKIENIHLVYVVFMLIYIQSFKHSGDIFSIYIKYFIYTFWVFL